MSASLVPHPHSSVLAALPAGVFVLTLARGQAAGPEDSQDGRPQQDGDATTSPRTPGLPGGGQSRSS